MSRIGATRRTSENVSRVRRIASTVAHVTQKYIYIHTRSFCFWRPPREASFGPWWYKLRVRAATSECEFWGLVLGGGGSLGNNGTVRSLKSSGYHIDIFMSNGLDWRKFLINRVYKVKMWEFTRVRVTY